MVGMQNLSGFYNKKVVRRYGFYMSLINYRRTVEHVVSRVSYLSSKPVVLDIGCGTGIATKGIIMKFPYADVFGMDFSQEMLKKYNDNFGKVRTIYADFNKSDSYDFVKDGSVDIVVSAGAVSEYGDVKVITPIIFKKLKKGGVFLNVGIKDKRFISGMTGRLWNYEAFGREKLSKLCLDSGFSNVRDIKIPFRFFPNNFLKFALIAEK